MSASESSSDESEPPWTMELDDDAPVKAYIDGQRVPVINDGIAVEYRKDGPTSITSMADLRYPAEWENHTGRARYSNLVDEGQLTQARIEMREDLQYGIESDSYETLINGYVSGTGGGGQTQNTLRARIVGPARTAANIPFSATYDGTNRGENSPTIPVDAVLREVETRIEDALPYEITIDSQVDEQLLGRVSDLDGARKRFTRNRHTVKDVLDWLADLLGTLYYFKYSGNGLTLVLDGSPHDLWVSERGDDTSRRNVRVMENNALNAISPKLGVVVTGASGFTAEVGPLSANIPHTGKQFPIAVAVSTALAQQTTLDAESLVNGGFIQRKETSVTNRQPAEGKARRAAKQLTDTRASGTMMLTPSPLIRPYDHIRARPTCDGYSSESVPRMDYEAERVKHIYRPQPTNDDQYRYRTEIQPSVFTDMNDISVVSQMVPIKKRSEALQETIIDLTRLAIEQGSRT